MGLLAAGYWPTTYWPTNYWPDDYWPGFEAEESANVKFTKGADTFQFSKGRSYPLHDPAQVSVITDLSESKQMYTFDKDVIVHHYKLYFKNLSQTDYNNFSNWLRSIAVGPKNTFTYKDEDGNNHTVRLFNTQNPLKKISHENFEGTIELRKEI